MRLVLSLLLLAIAPDGGAPDAPTDAGPRLVQLRNDGPQPILWRLRFDRGSARLRSDLDTDAEQVGLVETLAGHPEVTILELDGHASLDERDPERLSLQRAEAVRADLIRRGVAPARLTAKGLGAARPVMSNQTEEGREHNRRVELRRP
jgi:OOP family OmpA-OmpF porin